jgi:hypothetical protein
MSNFREAIPLMIEIVTVIGKTVCELVWTKIRTCFPDMMKMISLNHDKGIIFS